MCLYMRPVIISILLAACFIPAKASADRNYILPRQEVLAGVGFSNIHHDGNYDLIPIFWDIHFNVKRFFKMLHPQGAVDVIWEPAVALVFSPHNNVEVANNFLLEYDLLPSKFRVQPYFKGGVGTIFISEHIRNQSTQFNFNEYAGLGIHYFLTQNTALSLEYRFRHLSNAAIKEPNHGVNTYFVLLGISVRI